jgi:hypothetical protein
MESYQTMTLYRINIPRLYQIVHHSSIFGLSMAGHFQLDSLYVGTALVLLDSRYYPWFPSLYLNRVNAVSSWIRFWTHLKFLILLRPRQFFEDICIDHKRWTIFLLWILVRAF